MKHMPGYCPAVILKYDNLQIVESNDPAQRFNDRLSGGFTVATGANRIRCAQESFVALRVFP